MRYEREDIVELAKLPYNISKAVARGIGRIIVQKLEDFMFGEPDLSIDEWRYFEERSVEVNPDEFYDRFEPN